MSVDLDLYVVIVNKCQEISQNVQNSMDTNIPHVHSVLMLISLIIIIIIDYYFYNIFVNTFPFLFFRQLCNIDFKNSIKLTAMESVTTYNEPITYVLQPLLAIRVMLNPTTETQVLVDKLKMIRQIKVGSSNAQ